MGYHHKRETCAKGTKEVLENILKDRKTEYELLGSTETIRVGSPIEEIVEEEAVTNILPGDAEEIIEESEQVEVASEDIQDEMNELDSLVEYKAMIQVEFPVRDAKDEYEKKRKKRNYIEFRFDYA
ncbi:MAG: hypothetical protein BAJATHORv1_50187 [Candidatus Thorarchaeota archaeon]|nr:MAG: hypothetical protein BAJATHORv1_50187 [Candidatus Thorarchaeota archaeon]